MNNTATAETLQLDEQDALREVANIAMGQAGSVLAQVLDTYVALSVPRVRIVGISDLAHIIADLVGADHGVIGVRQAFYTNPRGEVIVLFDKQRCRSLSGLLGYDDLVDEFVEHEALLDVSNLIAGACMNGIASQLGAELSFSAPSIIFDGAVMDSRLDLGHADWTHMLLLEIHFNIESSGLSCHLIILTPEESIAMIRQEINRILQSL